MTSILDLLKSKVQKTKLQYIPRSYDLVGDIAIVEIKDEVKKHEKEIAKAIMAIHKNIFVVAKKASAMSGEFRTRKLKIIAGERRTETLYKEHDCIMRLDVAKAYFSSRLSNERKRIAELIKPKENVLVFFAGVGPFALVIAKKNPKASVTGIELNHVAVNYFKENIYLNKLKNCEAILGDVKRQARKFANSANRILMPLPQSAETFLDAAFTVAKNKAVVHFYNFAPADDPFSQAKEKISAAAKKNKCKIKIVNEKIVRPYAPHIVQVCIDFQVLGC